MSVPKYKYLLIGITYSRSSTSLVGFWWDWRHRHLMFFWNETLPLFRLCNDIHGSVNAIKSVVESDGDTIHLDYLIKWNSRNHHGSILNVDGSYIRTPTRTCYGGVLRNTAVFTSRASQTPSKIQMTSLCQSLQLFIKDWCWLFKWTLMIWFATQTPSEPSIQLRLTLCDITHTLF